MNSIFLQQQRGSRAGDFVGTGAVQDNISIAGDLMVAMVDFFHEQIECARDRLRIEFE